MKIEKKKGKQEGKAKNCSFNGCVAPRGYTTLELHVHPLWRLFCGRGTPPYGSAITQYDPFTVVSISFPKIATAGTKRQRQEREPLALEAG